MSNGHPFVGIFIRFCLSWPWTFFICLVYVAGSVVSHFVHSHHPRYSSTFSDLCFVAPIAPIPSCFGGRFATFLRSYPITLVVPEMMNLTVKSSQAGPSSNPPRFLYPTLVFNLFWMAYTSLIYAADQFFLSCQPIPSPCSPQLHSAGLCYRSSKSSLHTFSPTIFFYVSRTPLPLLPFFPSRPFFVLASRFLRKKIVILLSSIYTLHKCPPHTSYPQYIELFLQLVQYVGSALPRTFRVQARIWNCCNPPCPRSRK